MIFAATLKSRARMMVHTLVPQPGRRSPRGANAARVALALAVVLGVMAYLALRALLAVLTQAGGTLADAAAMIALLANLTLVGLLVFDLHEGVSALLSDSDLDLLRRAPLKPHVQLAIKLLDALPRTSLLMVVMLVPAVIAFQSAFGFHAWAWALLPVQALSLWALPLGLGAAAAMLMLRIVPARHAREALGLVSSLALFALWLANSFLLPRLGGDTGSVTDVRGAIAGLAQGMPGTPGGWLAAALTAAVSGDVAGALIGTGRLAAAATASIALVVWVASSSLEQVQARVLAAPTRRGRSAATVVSPGAEPTPLTRAMIVRDARLLGRNWTILGDLLVTVVLWTLLPVVLGPLFETSRGLLARTMLLALAVAVGSEVAARAVPLERGALIWARLSPVAPASWLAARLMGAALLSGALVALATIGSAWALGLGALDLLGVIALVAPALALALGIGLWAGVAFGDPEWTNPRAMLRPAGRLIATVLLIAQAIVWIGIAAHADGSGAPNGWVIGGAAVAAAFATTVAFVDGARRLGRLEAWGVT